MHTVASFRREVEFFFYPVRSFSHREFLRLLVRGLRCLAASEKCREPLKSGPLGQLKYAFNLHPGDVLFTRV